MADPDFGDLKRRMDGAVEVLRREFAGLRAGRASVGLVEAITVPAYGSPMPLSQLATISVPEPRMITVQVWDRSLAGAVEKAIRESDLGLNPAGEGQVIRIPIPMLSEERRTELGKVAGKYAEQARVAVRNVRRDGMDTLKKMEKDGEISEDEHRLWSDEIQDLTNERIKIIDEALSQKEEEIVRV